MSGFLLKLLAAVTMLIDHAGLLLFPGARWMRVVGRIAFPLYAYFIAEGFRYTHDRKRYFLQIFLLGAACQVVYTIADGTLYLGILITFSFSILLLALAREMCAAWQGDGTALGQWLTDHGFATAARRSLTTTAFFVTTILLALLTTLVRVDYGFCGILVPLAAYLPQKPAVRKLAFAGMLLVLSAYQWMLGDHVQVWCLLAMIPLCLYNGKPGKHRLKWFFYIFYPAHMAILYLLSLVF